MHHRWLVVLSIAVVFWKGISIVASSLYSVRGVINMCSQRLKSSREPLPQPRKASLVLLLEVQLVNPTDTFTMQLANCR